MIGGVDDEAVLRLREESRARVARERLRRIGGAATVAAILSIVLSFVGFAGIEQQRARARREAEVAAARAEHRATCEAHGWRRVDLEIEVLERLMPVPVAQDEPTVARIKAECASKLAAERRAADRDGCVEPAHIMFTCGEPRPSKLAPPQPNWTERFVPEP